MKDEVLKKIAEYEERIAKLEKEVDDYTSWKADLIADKKRAVRELTKTSAKINYNETHIDSVKYETTQELYDQSRELTDEINMLSARKKQAQSLRAQAILDLAKVRYQLAYLIKNQDSPTILDRLEGHHGYNRSKEEKLQQYYTYPSVQKRLADRQKKKEEKN